MPVVEEGDEEEAAKDVIASEAVDESKLEKEEGETQRADENEVLGEDEPIVGEGEDAGREESALQQVASLFSLCHQQAHFVRILIVEITSPLFHISSDSHLFWFTSLIYVVFYPYLLQFTSRIRISSDSHLFWFASLLIHISSDSHLFWFTSLLICISSDSHHFWFASLLIHISSDSHLFWFTLIHISSNTSLTDCQVPTGWGRREPCCEDGKTFSGRWERWREGVGHFSGPHSSVEFSRFGWLVYGWIIPTDARMIWSFKSYPRVLWIW